MNTNQKEKPKPIDKIPWITDGSHKSKEWEEKIEATMLKIRGTGKPGSILWDLDNRTVI